eukprot:TRINITY_DN59495_c0_g1_i2.p1 TRINITY_DN59495_c0_g1~~TRINITY_DN59495_c0_g1_i2.p1  ORF type:complete len:116 (-),score=42.72 TRINITY_DN59495_c0_g1_i2:58-405(-)
MCIRDRVSTQSTWEIKKLKLRAGRPADLSHQELRRPSEMVVDDWKEKMDIIKLELKSIFADKREFQNNTYKMDKIVAKPVSYTHLRAHETSLHLVCRLLLEKKKKQTINNTKSNN